MSSGMSMARAKSLPVPIGSSPITSSLEVVAAVQRRDHRVQAAVPAGHHDPAAGAVQHPVQPPGVGGGRDLDGGPGPQHLEALLRLPAAVPASLFMMTSKGSTGRSVDQRPRRPRRAVAAVAVR